MLTKRDLELIGDVVDTKIRAAFQDFYENLFEPHVTRFEEHCKQSAKEHMEILDEIKRINKHDDTQDEVLHGHQGRITDIERRVF